MTRTSEPLYIATGSKRRLRSSPLQGFVNWIGQRLLDWAGPPIDPDAETAVRDNTDLDADASLRKHDVDAWYRMHTGRDLQPDIRKDLGRFFAWLALASLIGFAVTGDGRWVWGGMVFLVDRVLSTWWRAE